MAALAKFPGLDLSAMSLIYLALLPVRAAASPEPTLTPDRTEVGQYERIEWVITAPVDYVNPYDPAEVQLDVEITRPDGVRVVLPAFFHQAFERRPLPSGGRSTTWMHPIGGPDWRARFAPEIPGPHEARAVLTDPAGVRRSAPVRFLAVPSTRRGHLEVSRQDPRFFATREGQPFFPIGQNLAFIGETQYLTLQRAEETLARLAAHGANYVRIWAGCHDWAMGIEARKSAFGRSWDWRPPFAVHPEDPERLCVRLEGPAGTRVAINPSHRVSLRPGTGYRFSGRVRTDGPTRLQVEGGGRRLADPVTGVAGEWIPWRLEFTTRPDEFWLGNTSLELPDGGAAWIDSLSLVQAAGGPELLWEADPNRPARGVYNQIDCFLLDEVLAAAERHEVRIQLTLFTRDLYMADLADETSDRYQRALDDARRLLRYAVGRWGCSTSLAVWEYFNEIDPGLPTSRFYRELALHLDQIDPYRHLRSTSTWHPSPRDWNLASLDFADDHFYLRPGDYARLRDEVDAVLDRVAFLRQQAPAKPVLLGEFGLANERWQPTEEMRQRPEIVDFHNALWASALSGASGTALFWWWDRLDPRNPYPHYRSLAAFLEGIPWTRVALRPAAATVVGPTAPVTGAGEARDEVVVVGLAGSDRAYLWLFNPLAAWKHVVVAGRQPAAIEGRRLTLEGLTEGLYRVSWWDTREGRILEEAMIDTPAGRLETTVPVFDRDLAVRLERVPSSRRE